jgi:Archaeal fructose-1,6-bisphosphatase and related enzymes of inositol monophosphatase family
MSNSTYLQAVAEVARLAGEIALRHYRQKVSIETKKDGTPVTIADRDAETAAREWIESKFPHDGILGEEFPDVRADSKYRWIIDPIDGTKSFIRDVPLWGTLVAVAEGHDIIAGAAFFPAVSEIIVAADGCGCWCNESPARVSDVTDLAQAVILTSAIPFSLDVAVSDRWRRLEERASASRTWGDCFGYLMVAAGRAEVMADPVLSSWDIAAFLPIVRESGGVMTDFRGQVTAFGGSAIATNGALARQVRDLLVETL